MALNAALNLDAFAVQSPNPAPPAINAIYLRDGKYDNNMKRQDVAATFAAFRAQTKVHRLALFFHGGLVDKASGQKGAANEYVAYNAYAFPLFFIWESGFWEVLAHHLPLIFAETIFGRIVQHVLNVVSSKRTQAQAPAVERFGVFEASLNVTDTSLASATLTNADIDAFMSAIKNDPVIQHEAAAIARTSASADSLLAKKTSTNTLQLSPRTHLSPQVVSGIRGAYIQGNGENIGSGKTMDELDFDPLGATRAAWEIAKSAVPILITLFKRFADGRDHGITCTIVEEVLRALYLANTGSSIWQEMKGKRRMPSVPTVTLTAEGPSSKSSALI